MVIGLVSAAGLELCGQRPRRPAVAIQTRSRLTAGEGCTACLPARRQPVRTRPMFRFFETLIDPFRQHDEGMPPRTLAGFYWYYTRQVWPVLAALLVVGLFVSLIEVSIFRYIGTDRRPAQVDDARQGALRLRADLPVDGLRRGGGAAAGDHPARPAGAAVAGAVLHQSGALADAPLRAAPDGRLLQQRLRRAHRLEDRPDRPGAARVRGAGVRRAVVRHHLRGELACPLRPARAGADGAAGHLDRRLRRHHRPFRAAHPPALGRSLRGALDADRTHRRQLHQHPDGEALRPYLARGRLRPRRGRRPPDRSSVPRPG